METLQETLYKRVDELIETSKSNESFLNSTPQAALIGELASRIQGLENAIRLLTAEIHELSSAARERLT
jgi:hypothetical protein